MVRHGAFQFNVRPMSRLDYVMALVLIMSAEYLRLLCTEFKHRTIPYSALTKTLFFIHATKLEAYTTRGHTQENEKRNTHKQNALLDKGMNSRNNSQKSVSELRLQEVS